MVQRNFHTSVRTNLFRQHDGNTFIFFSLIVKSKQHPSFLNNAHFVKESFLDFNGLKIGP